MQHSGNARCDRRSRASPSRGIEPVFEVEMLNNDAGGGTVETTIQRAQPRSAAPRQILFRILGPHQHYAVTAAGTFGCTRLSTVTENGLAVRWLASKNDAVLKDDCRTLNEAKNVCREAASQDRSAAAEPANATKESSQGTQALPAPF
jgi:hypothetical protein